MKEQWVPTIGDKVIHPVTLIQAKITAFGKYERSAVLYSCNNTGCFHFDTANIFEWELDNSGCTTPPDNTKQDYSPSSISLQIDKKEFMKKYIPDDLQFFNNSSCTSPGPVSLTSQEEITKPERYNKKGKLECWDVILDQEMNFLEGNILKYIWRHREKNGVEDLKKARVYLDKLISQEEKK